jgi:hypothetical protein
MPHVGNAYIKVEWGKMNATNTVQLCYINKAHPIHHHVKACHGVHHDMAVGYAYQFKKG